MRLRLVYLVFLVLLLDQWTLAQRNRRQIQPSVVGNVRPRIVGGQRASIANIKSLVQVHRGNTLCGGALIRPRWVLTAAHCVRGFNIGRFFIIGGTSIWNGTDGVARTVDAAFVAPRFNRRTLNKDAALLKLNAAMTGTNIGVARLAQRRPNPGTRIRVGGWGSTREGGPAATNLSTVVLQVVNRNFCQRSYRGDVTITNFMFCASSLNKDSCSGDSGGGAYHNNRLAGLVSFGRGCARRGSPGVYTNVAILRRWIQNTIANNS